MSEHTELIMEGHLCEGCGVFLKTHGIKGVSRQACEKAAAALAAQQPQPDLHAAIMNLPCVVPPPFMEGLEATDQRVAYKMGHRDARHAAAELVSATPAPSFQAGDGVLSTHIARTYKPSGSSNG